MKDISKEDKKEIITKLEKAFKKEEDIVVITDGMTFLRGEPTGVLANLCKAFKYIHDAGEFGAIVVEATLQTLNKEFKEGEK